jgi:hypothetical protein
MTIARPNDSRRFSTAPSSQTPHSGNYVVQFGKTGDHRSVRPRDAAVDFRPRTNARRWWLGGAVAIAMAAAVALLRGPSAVEECRASCFDAFARCTGAAPAQCEIARDACEQKCSAPSQEPTVAASEP